MTKHRVHYKLFGEGKFARLRVFDIFDAHGVENCKIELVEEFPCENKEQLNKREGFYIQSNECVNRNIAGRTLAEWMEDTRDHRNEVARRWKAANPEKVKEIEKRTRAKHHDQIRAKAAAKELCDVCGAEVSHHHLQRHKRSDKCTAAQAIEEKAPITV